MAFHNVLNNAGSTLTASVATTDLTISVTADVFPLAPFYLTLGGNPSVYEIVEVTLKTGLVFTVGRAKDGTTAKAYVAGDLVQLFMTAGIVSELQAEVIAHEANTSPHGATASATANTIALRDANGNVVSNLPVTNRMNPNLLFNPTFRFGLTGWTLTNSGGSNWVATFGYYGEGGVVNCGSVTNGTPVLTSRSIPCNPGVTITLSGEMYTGGVTAGSQNFDVQFSDSSHAIISIGNRVSVTTQNGWTRYSVTNTSPANTAYVNVRLYGDTSFTTTNSGWRKIKLEQGSIATTFSDDNTLNTVQYGGVLPLAQILSGGNKVQSGTNTLTVATAGTQVQVGVTLPVQFATIPLVYPVISYSSIDISTFQNAIAGLVTVSGFALYVNSGKAQTLTINWTAIGT